jgi:hypothetical protein
MINSPQLRKQVEQRAARTKHTSMKTTIRDKGETGLVRARLQEAGTASWARR